MARRTLCTSTRVLIFEKLLADWYSEAIFDLELVDWMRDMFTWPENRTVEMFYEWFEVELVTEVVNLARGRIKSG